MSTLFYCMPSCITWLAVIRHWTAYLKMLCPAMIFTQTSAFYWCIGPHWRVNVIHIMQLFLSLFFSLIWWWFHDSTASWQPPIGWGNASRNPGWRSGLRHCIAGLEASLQTWVRSWVCITNCHDWESHKAAHNWPSFVRVRGGFGRVRPSL